MILIAFIDADCGCRPGNKFHPPSATLSKASPFPPGGKVSIRSGVGRAAQWPTQMRPHKAQTMKCPPNGHCHFIVEPVRDAETDSTGRRKERQHGAAAAGTRGDRPRRDVPHDLMISTGSWSLLAAMRWALRDPMGGQGQAGFYERDMRRAAADTIIFDTVEGVERPTRC